MLAGLERNTIITGAYTDRSGGVCPMLAAHRNGGRTSLASFARAWDRYTRAREPRSATEREVRTLRAMLVASVELEEIHGGGTLGAAIAEHRALASARPPVRRRPHADTGERERTEELRGKAGWSWLRPVRSLEEYERALTQLGSEERQPEPEAAFV